MKAKFINEQNIRDVLKPKSEEEILSLLSKLHPNELLIKSSKLGFISGVKLALERGADVHVNNDEALYQASYWGYKDAVELLLKNGADIHSQDNLAWAAQWGYKDVVELLLKNGADVHANDDLALSQAAWYGNRDIVELLLKNGANITSETISKARQSYDKNMMELLKKYI